MACPKEKPAMVKANRTTTLGVVEEKVHSFYAARPREEWSRLFANPYARLEYDTTIRFIKEYLNGSKKTVLDAGGGPGRYTVELAKKGHHVVLLDPVGENLEFARKQIRRAGVLRDVSLTEGSIENLSAFPDENFDLVLCLGGPLSHVMKESVRVKAVAELVRVTKSSGLLFVSVIGRLSPLVQELENGFKYTGVALSRRLRDKGDYYGERIFTPFHGFLPDELIRLFESVGRTIVLEMVGLQGIGSNHLTAVNKLAKDKALWKFWTETHYMTCTNPGVVGLAEHILLIARKQ